MEDWWGQFIPRTHDLDAGGLISAASLLFAAGARPHGRAIAALARSHSGFAVSFDPGAESSPAPGHGAATGSWLELLADGLTFDVAGLTPGPTADPPPRSQDFGLPEELDDELLEAIILRPGPHLAEGAALPPVVRTLAWLAAQLADLPGARAVAWHPARSWCGTAHFRGSVLRWIEGGAFPGLGLAALTTMPDGGMQSQGLVVFIGQELRLEPELVGKGANAASLGLRLMHWLVEHGRLLAPERIVGPDGLPLRLEPSANGRFARVWKG